MSCILCTNTTAETINLFGDKGKSLKIPEIVSKHFWFAVDESNEFHREIYVDCWRRTSSFNRFYDRALDAHLKRPGSIKVEYLNAPIKCEAILEDHQDESENPMAHSVKYESVPSSNLITWQQIESTTTQDDVFDDVNDSGVTDQSELERKMTDYFRMNCDLCSEHLRSMEDIQQHFKNKHNINRGYLRCCDCSNRKFKMRRQIIDHITWHCNPNAFKCTKCPRTFTEQNRLVRHHTTHHTADEKLIFCCDLCKKRFSKKGILNEHVKRVHPPDDQSFSCDICQKEYKTRRLLHNHMQTVHNPKCTKHICDICARVMSSKHTLKEHLKTHTDDGERFNCDECGAILKSQSSFINHKKMHTDKEQTCDICFKVKPNRSALFNHKRNVHGTAKHKCSYCDKAFRRLMSLREHVATHTGTSLYTCSFCPATFKSSANKFKHYKQVHNKQWKASKELKK